MTTPVVVETESITMETEEGSRAFAAISSVISAPLTSAGATSVANQPTESSSKANTLPEALNMLQKAGSRRGSAESETLHATLDDGNNNDRKYVEVSSDSATEDEMIRILPSRTYMCRECGATTSSAVDHLYHMRNEHGEMFPIYRCDLCDYASRYKQKWQRHRQCHFSSPVLSSTSPSSLTPSGDHTRSSTPQSRSPSPQDRPIGVSFAAVTPMHATSSFVKSRDKTSNSGTSTAANSESDVGLDLKCAGSPSEFSTHNEVRSMKRDGISDMPADMPDDKRLFQQRVTSTVIGGLSGASELRRLEEMANLHGITMGQPAISHLDQEQQLQLICGKYGKTQSLLDSSTSRTGTASWTLDTPSHAEGRGMASEIDKSQASTVKTDMRGHANVEGKKSSAAIQNPIKPKLYAPFREAVDPAKYITIQEADGIKYACSKCGNVYKWRKSLNKHWKEKHDGEIPDPRNNYTPLAIPRVRGEGLPATPNRKESSPLMAAALKQSGISSQPSKLPFQHYSRMIASRNQFVNPNPPALVGKENMPKSCGLGQMKYSPVGPSMPQGDLSVKKNLPLSSVVSASCSTPSELPSPVSMTNKVSPPKHTPPAAHSNGPRFHVPPLDGVVDLSTAISPTFSGGSTDDGALDLSVKGAAENEARSLAEPPPPQDEPLDFSKKTPGTHMLHTEGIIGSQQQSTLFHASFNDSITGEQSQGSSLSLRCPSCSYIAISMDDYNHHMEVHLRKNVYRCASCQESFPSSEGLNSHFRVHHYDILLNPSSVLSGQARAVSLHKSTSTNNGSHQLYKYLTMEGARDRQSLNCLVCGAVFQWQWTLAKHFDSDHPGMPNPYRKKEKSTDCQDVDMAMPKKPRLPDQVGVSHLETTDPSFMKGGQSVVSSLQSPVKCNQCEFVTTSHAEMARHHQKHSISPQYTCKVCTFTTRWREDMHNHCKRYHPGMDLRIIWQDSTGGTPREFSGESTITPLLISPDGGMLDLTVDGTPVVIPQAPEDTDAEYQHSLSAGRMKGPKSKLSTTTNSAEMLLPYKCSVCEYRARWPSEISQHMKNHSDEKPFHCPRCSYRSKWKWDVVKHLKRCGGGTVKDVIDMTKIRRSDESTRFLMAAASPYEDNGSAPIMAVSGHRETLSNGPPNITISPSAPGERVTSPPLLVKTEAEPGTDTAVKQENKPCPDTVIFQNNCNHCPFVANSPAELRRHARVHSDEKPFVCLTCGYSSKWKCDLKKHLRTYNHESAVPLTYGGHGRKPAEWYEQQKQQETEKSSGKESAVKLTCSRCSFTTRSKEEMENHTNMHQMAGTSVGSILHCPKCEFECDDFGIFLQHKMKHNREEETLCNSISDSVDPSSSSKHRRKPLKQFVMRNPNQREEDGETSEDAESSSAQNRPGSGEDSNIEPEKSALLAALGLEVTSKVQKMPKKRPAPPVGTVMPIIQEPNWLALSHVTSSFMSSKMANYRCAHCPYSTDNRTTFEKHMRMHNTPNRYMCEWCNWSTDRLNLLYRHAQSVHPEELATEEKESFYDKVRERSYSEGSRESTPLRMQSSPCKSPTPSKSSIKRKDNVSSEKKLADGMIKKSFKKAAARRDDGMSGKTKRKMKTCGKCAYITDNVTTLQRHMAKHGFPGKYTCRHCDYSVNKRHIRDYHMTIVHENSSNTEAKNGDDDEDIADSEVAEEETLEEEDPEEEMEDEEEKSDQYITDNEDVQDVLKKKDVVTEITRVRGIQMRVIRDQNKTLYGCLKCTFVTANITNAINHSKQHGKKKKVPTATLR